MVRTGLPFSYTVIFLVALSTFISNDRPILAVALRSTSPYRPLLSGIPASAIRTVMRGARLPVLRRPVVGLRAVADPVPGARLRRVGAGRTSASGPPPGPSSGCPGGTRPPPASPRRSVLSSKRYRPEPIVDFGLAIVVNVLVPWSARARPRARRHRGRVAWCRTSAGADGTQDEPSVRSLPATEPPPSAVRVTSETFPPPGSFAPISVLTGLFFVPSAGLSVSGGPLGALGVDGAARARGRPHVRATSRQRIPASSRRRRTRSVPATPPEPGRPPPPRLA